MSAISFIGGPADGRTSGGPDQSGGLAALLGGAPGSSPAPDAGGSATAILKRLVQDIHAAIPQMDDPQDAQELMKCLSAVQGIIANEQKEKDQAMQGKMSPRMMRKATPGTGVSY